MQADHQRKTSPNSECTPSSPPSSKGVHALQNKNKNTLKNLVSDTKCLQCHVQPHAGVHAMYAIAIVPHSEHVTHHHARASLHENIIPILKLSKLKGKTDSTPRGPLFRGSMVMDVFVKMLLITTLSIFAPLKLSGINIWTPSPDTHWDHKKSSLTHNYLSFPLPTAIWRMLRSYANMLSDHMKTYECCSQRTGREHAQRHVPVATRGISNKIKN